MTELDEAKRVLVDVGLGTYGRKLHEMTETADWQKLQMVDREVRKAIALIDRFQRRDDVEGVASLRA